MVMLKQAMASQLVVMKMFNKKNKKNNKKTTTTIKNNNKNKRQCKKEKYISKISTWLNVSLKYTTIQVL